MPRHEVSQRLNSILRILYFAFPLCFALNLFAARESEKLPEPVEILPELYQNPIQGNVRADPFTFPYMGSNYHIYPQRFYEIHGLVVSHNNTTGIGDMYHDSSSVDLKDLCLVWGNNLRSSVYQKADYWSEPWTCLYRFDDRKDFKRFHHDALSNNHLLSHRAEVRDLIRKAKRGDQVKLRGMLIDYAPARNPEHLRKTSLVRNDTGNGACEVLFVDSMEILKQGNPGWRFARKLFGIASWISAGAIPLLFLIVVYREQFERSRALEKVKRKTDKKKAE